MAAHLGQCLTSNIGNSRVPVMALRVHQAGLPVFWLQVAAAMDARLGQNRRSSSAGVAGVLRAYERVLQEPAGRGRYEWRMTEEFGATGDELREHDLGSTELSVRFSGVAKSGAGKPFVATGNEPPAWPCDVCGFPTASVCSECGWMGTGFCCAKHMADHECGQDRLLPVVNSRGWASAPDSRLT